MELVLSDTVAPDYPKRSANDGQRAKIGHIAIGVPCPIRRPTSARFER